MAIQNKFDHHKINDKKKLIANFQSPLIVINFQLLTFGCHNLVINFWLPSNDQNFNWTPILVTNNLVTKTLFTSPTIVIFNHWWPNFKFLIAFNHHVLSLTKAFQKHTTCSFPNLIANNQKMSIAIRRSRFLWWRPKPIFGHQQYGDQNHFSITNNY
jgi:hypothetical protein